MWKVVAIMDEFHKHLREVASIRLIFLKITFLLILTSLFFFSIVNSATQDDLLLDILRNHQHTSEKGDVSGLCSITEFPIKATDEDIQKRITEYQNKISEQAKDLSSSAKNQARRTIKEIPEIIKNQYEGKTIRYQFNLIYLNPYYRMIKYYINDTSFFSLDTQNRYDEIFVYNNGKYVWFKALAEEIEHPSARVYASDKSFEMIIDPRDLGCLPKDVYDAIFFQHMFSIVSTFSETYKNHNTYGMILSSNQLLVLSRMKPFIKVLIDPEYNNKLIFIQSYTELQHHFIPHKTLAFSEFAHSLNDQKLYPSHAEELDFGFDSATFSFYTSRITTIDIISCKFDSEITDKEILFPSFPKDTLVVDYRFKIPYQYYEEIPPLSEKEVSDRALAFSKKVESSQMSQFNQINISRNSVLLIILCFLISLLVYRIIKRNMD